MEKSDSLYKEAWNKLKRDPLAKSGIAIILFLSVIAILGPSIRPIKTKDADLQILQIKSQSPGFNIDLVFKVKNVDPKSTNFIEGTLFGYENSFTPPVPVVDYWDEGEYLYMVRFMGSYDMIDTVKEKLIDIAYPLNLDSISFVNQNDNYSFNTLEGRVNVSREELLNSIKDDMIENQTYWLGTDRNGRDFLSRVMAGTRISLGVGVVGVSISVIIGVILGAISGFYRGWVDNLITWVTSVFWSIPALLLVIAITLSLGKGIQVVFIAVGLTMWVEVARIVRGQFLSLSQFEFVEAGKALGFKKRRIIFKHVLPNTIGPIIVVSVSNFATAILLEAGLSFLGLGAQPPTASWGEMVGAYQGYLVGDYPHLAIVPGVAIVITVIAFFMLGNGLRDAFDVKDIKK